MTKQALLILVLLAMVSVGCTPASPAAAPQPAAPTQAPAQPAAPTQAPAQPAAPTQAPAAVSASSGKITISQPTDIVEVDPHRTLWSSDSSFHFALFDSLIQRNSETMELVPVLADSWENTGPTEWTFRIHQGIKFHNGEPLTAHTIKWNVDRAMDPNEKREPSFKIFAGADIVDDYTVTIRTSKPDPAFLAKLVRFFILPEKYLTDVGYDKFIETPVGSGPYRFISRERGSSIAMEANEEYWRGVPAIKTLIWKVIPEASTALAALMNGEVDLVAKLSPDDVIVVENNPNLQVKKVLSARGLVGQFFADSPQGTGEPIKDVRVRQALQMGINAQAYIDTILGGNAQRVSTYMPPNVFAYNTDLEPYPYDPEKAKQLLAEAGYPDGFELKMDVPATFIIPKVPEVAQAMAADLQKIGVKLTLRMVEQPTLIKYRDERTIGPAFLWSWGGDSFDPWQYYQVITCTNPWSFYCDEKLDEMYNAALATMDQDERAAIYKELQAYVWEQAPMWFIYNGVDLYGADKDLNFTPRSDERIIVREMSWNE